MEKRHSLYAGLCRIKTEEDMGSGSLVTAYAHGLIESGCLVLFALVPLYNAADVFVFPSFYEGFGIPLIEAMACGTPVVCSDWELFHEVCGKAALFADPYRPDAFAEAIAQVLTDHSLAATLSKRGLERAMMFTWEQTARKTLAVYHQMMEESG